MIFFEKFLIKWPWLWNIFKCSMSFSVFHEKICSGCKWSNHKGEKDKETHNTLNTWHDYAYKLPCLIKLFHFQNQVEPSTKINERQQRVSCWGHFTQCTHTVNKNQNNHDWNQFRAHCYWLQQLQNILIEQNHFKLAWTIWMKGQTGT